MRSSLQQLISPLNQNMSWVSNETMIPKIWGSLDPNEIRFVVRISTRSWMCDCAMPPWPCLVILWCICSITFWQHTRMGHSSQCCTGTVREWNWSWDCLVLGHVSRWKEACTTVAFNSHQTGLLNKHWVVWEAWSSKISWWKWTNCNVSRVRKMPNGSIRL